MLFQELKPKPGEQQISLQVLHGFLMLSSKERSDIEGALTEFFRILQQDHYKDHVGALLGVATAHMILKQVNKGKY